MYDIVLGYITYTRCSFTASIDTLSFPRMTVNLNMRYIRSAFTFRIYMVILILLSDLLQYLINLVNPINLINPINPINLINPINPINLINPINPINRD